MLPRRGYEPVDDRDGDDPTHQSNSSTSPGASNIEHHLANPNPGAMPDAINKSTTSDTELSDGEEDGRITVRVLDVRGQFYPLRVHPESTVRELKQDLVNATGVEFGRQRIIYGGKVSCSVFIICTPCTIYVSCLCIEFKSYLVYHNVWLVGCVGQDWLLPCCFLLRVARPALSFGPPSPSPVDGGTYLGRHLPYYSCKCVSSFMKCLSGGVHHKVTEHKQTRCRAAPTKRVVAASL